MKYKDKIDSLIDKLQIDIDKNVEIKGRAPTAVSSEFITNKEQGDWAERLVYNLINRNDDEYVAVRYGVNDDLSAGDQGFKEYYSKYQRELNNIGKRPDILIFHRKDIETKTEISDCMVKRAICALEVRSSSFLLKKYNDFMKKRTEKAYQEIEKSINTIRNDSELSLLLQQKDEVLYGYLMTASRSTFDTLTFRVRNWSSTPKLEELSSILKKIKNSISEIQKRDFLSITPKVEDIALVNRWIQKYNVPHYYLQVFFDSAYIISFEDILNIASDYKRESIDFSIEKDVKNQGKTTIKINVHAADLIIDEIKIPEHYSSMKELDRGRLLFFVKFRGDSGYIKGEIFKKLMAGATDD